MPIDASPYVSGTIYSYSFLCMRKVWLFYHHVHMEQNSENVQLGKHIDETSYKREKHSFMIGNAVNIDFLRNNIVHEVKKSDRQKQMAINQIKYYLYILKKHGFDGVRGCLNIPSMKHTESVLLEEGDDEVICKQLDLIRFVVDDKKIPDVMHKGFCKKCAYFEFCYI